jgi:hypothetical protein
MNQLNTLIGAALRFYWNRVRQQQTRPALVVRKVVVFITDGKPADARGRVYTQADVDLLNQYGMVRTPSSQLANCFLTIAYQIS